MTTHRFRRTPAHSLAIATLAVLASVASVAPLRAQDPAVRALDAYVERAVRDWGVPGLGIAIVRNDSVLLAKGYGVREVGRPDRVDAHTRFAIGSTTKAMTAVALGMLVDEGKLDWDDRVVTHLPAFRLSDPWVTSELTVRDLLTHRAGLGNADMLWSGGDHARAEILQRMASLPPAYSMRSGFIYQNIMYAVAGEVVAAVSGMSWEEFVRTRLLAPLGMRATATTLAGVHGQPNVASPHALVRDTLRVVANRPVDPVAAAGSVWSSVADMANWMRFVLDSGRVGERRLLSVAGTREMLSPQVVAPEMYPATRLSRPHFFTYGLAWFLHDYAGDKVAMHTGSIDGMSAIVGLLPDRRLGVVVLINRDHSELRHALMYRVFDVLGRGAPTRDWSRDLRSMLDSLAAARTADERARDERSAAGAKAPPSLPLERYAGTFANPTFGSVRVTLRDGGLRLAFGRRYDGTLTHREYDTFRATWSDPRSSGSSVIFESDGTGRIARVRIFGNTFTRVQEP